MLIPDALRSFDLVQEVVTAGPHRFEILKPRTADDLISEDEYSVDERLPYWAELWPSAQVLAAMAGVDDDGTDPRPLVRPRRRGGRSGPR